MSLPVCAFTKRDVVERGRVRQADIDELRIWLEGRNYPEMTDEQLVLFLLSCDRHQEAARHTIDAYFKARRSAPELFDGRDVDSGAMQEILKLYLVGLFPIRTEDNCVFAFVKLNNTSFVDFSIDHTSKLLNMAIDSALYEYPPDGLIIFIDLRGVGLMHVTKLRLGSIRKMLYYLQEGMPLKLRAIHLMNTVYFIDKIMALFKPFMKKEMADLMYYHSSSANMDDFYKEHVAAKYLPEDYGGAAPSLKQLHEAFWERMCDLREYFEAEENQRRGFVAE